MKYLFFALLLTLGISWYLLQTPAILLSESLSLPKEIIEPKGLLPIPWPTDNPYTQKKAELGRLLYFDKRLSSNATVSCASCHAINYAFADNKSVSIGILNAKGTRNSPTIVNTAYQTLWFWDGRASSLEEQCKGPLANPREMTLITDPHAAHQECHERIKNIAGYNTLFKEVFGTDNCSIDDLAKAIATYERTILSGNSPYDRYMAGDKSAMTPEQIKGYQVFKHSGCANCHFGNNFTDGRFLNIGVGMDQPDPDTGRYAITKKERDWGAFKVPTLREVANTAPYMHDGSQKTLEEVVEYYNKGGIPNRNLHPSMRPLHLSEADKEALVAFMHALSGEGWQHHYAPDTFPE
jgi:cytochrome c peroxidase